MTNLRIGHGYDVHRITAGRPLILGGVTIPWDRGLLGHSDADVLTHAVMDALCGGAGLGDIGMLFPDTDPQYEGVSSLILLEQVGARLRERGFTVVNVDATLLAQKPKIAPWKPQMAENLAAALGIPAERVNVKATTEEGLGFTGDSSGMAAHAVALLERVAEATEHLWRQDFCTDGFNRRDGFYTDTRFGTDGTPLIDGTPFTDENPRIDENPLYRRKS